MFRIVMLPAGHGDCLWVEYGDSQSPHRILVDGGPPGTYKRILAPRLERLPAEQRKFELLVVTHVDSDHIGGILDLLDDSALGFEARDIWFNGYRHLPDPGELETGVRPEPANADLLGGVQGERLTTHLLRRPRHWNAAFDCGRVALPQAGDIPAKRLPGGMSITLLSPTLDKLAKLKPKWLREVQAAGLAPNIAVAEPEEELELLGAPDIESLVHQPFFEDDAEANGSSIALMLEFDGRRVLLAGDAHPGVLTSSIQQLSARESSRGGKLRFDVCKLPHHASKSNVSPALLAAINCPCYFVSTSGAYFRHPDQQALARVIKLGGDQPALHFNYRTEQTRPWAETRLMEKYLYSTAYPTGDDDGIMMEWP